MALNPDLGDLLEAALDRVIPGDDGPGASDANAALFVTWFLTQPPFDEWCVGIERGLQLLNTVATDRCGKSFVACTAAERDAVMRALMHAPQPSVQRFMRRLVALAINGFLCDPKYGGNRDGAGWRYIGFVPRV
jgi:gluconate 2-dehydrogenase gamma chain